MWRLSGGLWIESVPVLLCEPRVRGRQSHVKCRALCGSWTFLRPLTACSKPRYWIRTNNNIYVTTSVNLDAKTLVPIYVKLAGSVPQEFEKFRFFLHAVKKSEHCILCITMAQTQKPFWWFLL
jgi:hypothetical protein